MICPQCGSHSVELVPITTTVVTDRTKGFGCIKACLGWLIFSTPGLLCGLCGMGKGSTTTTHHTHMVKKCRNCGKQF